MNSANLIKLQHFFEVDVRIKKEMLNMAPPTESGYLDENSVCKYADNLNDSLIYIFSELKSVALDVFGDNSPVFNRVLYLEKNIKNNFYNCGLDINKLRNFYKNCISNMEPTFVNEVKANCVGYSLFGTLPLNRTNSINEVLHLIHSFVLNSESILQSIPVLEQKVNSDDYPIVLRGVSTDVFKQLFEQFPTNLNVGWTDMVSLNEKKLLMMVRDRGHALTIEVTLNDNIARIEYFIPKLCNIDMINALPGVNKVNQNSVGATGVIETDINYLSQTLFTFISKVPMDSDMVFEPRTR